MEKNPIRSLIPLLLLNTILVVITTGCASHEENSFNKDYNQNVPTSPKYYFENIDDNHFKVIVHQGSPMQGPERVIFVKQVASTVAGTEAKRRGWENWELNYIQNRDQGWMRIVIGEVTRKNAVELTPDAASHLQAQGGSDAAKNQGAAMGVAGAAAVAGLPGQVRNLTLVSGNPGELDAQWDSDAAAKSYEIQTSADPVTAISWVAQPSVTKSSAVLQGLTSGSRQSVRVRAVGSAGAGAWSDPATKIVP
jgi:hypothetical protein